MCNNKCEKLLGVKFDHKFTFANPTSELCKRASQKIHALARLTPHINTSKRHILMNTFFTWQLVTVLSCGCVAVILTIGR